MLTVLLVLQVIITVSMIIVILIQRSASDGMAGLAGGGNSLMSGRASANLLTRITSFLAAAFMLNSLVMAAMTARSANNEKSILDNIKIEQKSPAGAPATTAPAKGANDNTSPTKPVEGNDEEQKPSVPIAD